MHTRFITYLPTASYSSIPSYDWTIRPNPACCWVHSSVWWLAWHHLNTRRLFTGWLLHPAAHHFWSWPCHCYHPFSLWRAKLILPDRSEDGRISTEMHIRLALLEVPTIADPSILADFSIADIFATRTWPIAHSADCPDADGPDCENSRCWGQLWVLLIVYFFIFKFSALWQVQTFNGSTFLSVELLYVQTIGVFAGWLCLGELFGYLGLV